MESNGKTRPDGVEISAIGALYQGPLEKKYWSSSRGKEKYPYPVGYQATRWHGGHTYYMEVSEGPRGPLFAVTCEEGISCSGQTPSVPWEDILKKRHAGAKKVLIRSSSASVDGPEMFGFTNPLVQRLCRDLLVSANGLAEPSGVEVSTKVSDGTADSLEVESRKNGVLAESSRQSAAKATRGKKVMKSSQDQDVEAVGNKDVKQLQAGKSVKSLGENGKRRLDVEEGEYKKPKRLSNRREKRLEELEDSAFDQRVRTQHVSCIEVGGHSLLGPSADEGVRKHNTPTKRPRSSRAKGGFPADDDDLQLVRAPQTTRHVTKSAAENTVTGNSVLSRQKRLKGQKNHSGHCVGIRPPIRYKQSRGPDVSTAEDSISSGSENHQTSFSAAVTVEDSLTTVPEKSMSMSTEQVERQLGSRDRSFLPQATDSLGPAAPDGTVSKNDKKKRLKLAKPDKSPVQSETYATKVDLTQSNGVLSIDLMCPSVDEVKSAEGKLHSCGQPLHTAPKDSLSSAGGNGVFLLLEACKLTGDDSVASTKSNGPRRMVVVDVTANTSRDMEVTSLHVVSHPISESMDSCKEGLKLSRPVQTTGDFHHTCCHPGEVQEVGEIGGVMEGRIDPSDTDAFVWGTHRPEVAATVPPPERIQSRGPDPHAAMTINHPISPAPEVKVKSAPPEGISDCDESLKQQIGNIEPPLEVGNGENIPRGALVPSDPTLRAKDNGVRARRTQLKFEIINPDVASSNGGQVTNLSATAGVGKLGIAGCPGFTLDLSPTTAGTGLKEIVPSMNVEAADADAGLFAGISQCHLPVAPSRSETEISIPDLNVTHVNGSAEETGTEISVAVMLPSDVEVKTEVDPRKERTTANVPKKTGAEYTYPDAILPSVVEGITHVDPHKDAAKNVFEQTVVAEVLSLPVVGPAEVSEVDPALRLRTRTEIVDSCRTEVPSPLIALPACDKVLSKMNGALQVKSGNNPVNCGRQVIPLNGPERPNVAEGPSLPVLLRSDVDVLHEVDPGSKVIPGNVPEESVGTEDPSMSLELPADVELTTGVVPGSKLLVEDAPENITDVTERLLPSMVLPTGVGVSNVDPEMKAMAENGPPKTGASEVLSPPFLICTGVGVKVDGFSEMKVTAEDVPQRFRRSPVDYMAEISSMAVRPVSVGEMTMVDPGVKIMIAERLPENVSITEAYSCQYVLPSHVETVSEVKREMSEVSSQPIVHWSGVEMRTKVDGGSMGPVGAPLQGTSATEVAFSPVQLSSEIAVKSEVDPDLSMKDLEKTAAADHRSQAVVLLSCVQPVRGADHGSEATAENGTERISGADVRFLPDMLSSGVEPRLALDPDSSRLPVTGDGPNIDVAEVSTLPAVSSSAQVTSEAYHGGEVAAEIVVDNSGVAEVSLLPVRLSCCVAVDPGLKLQAGSSLEKHATRNVHVQGGVPTNEDEPAAGVSLGKIMDHGVVTVLHSSYHVDFLTDTLPDMDFGGDSQVRKFLTDDEENLNRSLDSGAVSAGAHAIDISSPKSAPGKNILELNDKTVSTSVALVMETDPNNEISLGKINKHGVITVLSPDAKVDPTDTVTEEEPMTQTFLHDDPNEAVTSAIMQEIPEGQQDSSDTSTNVLVQGTIDTKQRVDCSCHSQPVKVDPKIYPVAKAGEDSQTGRDGRFEELQSVVSAEEPFMVDIVDSRRAEQPRNNNRRRENRKHRLEFQHQKDIDNLTKVGLEAFADIENLGAVENDLDTKKRKDIQGAAESSYFSDGLPREREITISSQDQSQKGESDSMGREITKAMISLLLPQAVPLLTKGLGDRKNNSSGKAIDSRALNGAGSMNGCCAEKTLLTAELIDNSRRTEVGTATEDQAIDGANDNAFVEGGEPWVWRMYSSPLADSAHESYQESIGREWRAREQIGTAAGSVPSLMGSFRGLSPEGAAPFVQKECPDGNRNDQDIQVDEPSKGEEALLVQQDVSDCDAQVSSLLGFSAEAERNLSPTGIEENDNLIICQDSQSNESGEDGPVEKAIDFRTVEEPSPLPVVSSKLQEQVQDAGLVNIEFHMPTNILLDYEGLPFPVEPLSDSRKMESTLCIDHEIPVTAIVLNVRGNEVRLCVICGDSEGTEITFLVYKMLSRGNLEAMPQLLSTTTTICENHGCGPKVPMGESAVRFAPDGQQLILLDCFKLPDSCYSNKGNHNGRGVNIVSLEKDVFQISEHLRSDDLMQCLAVPEPQLLVAAGNNGCINCWKMNSGWRTCTDKYSLPRATCDGTPFTSVTRLAIMPGLPHVLIGCNYGGSFAIWDTGSRTLLSTCHLPNHNVVNASLLNISTINLERNGVLGKHHQKNGRHENASGDSRPDLPLPCFLTLVFSRKGSKFMDSEERSTKLEGDEREHTHLSCKIVVLKSGVVLCGAGLPHRASAVTSMGRYGVMGTTDGLVHIWEVETGRKLCELNELEGSSIVTLASNPSSAVLAAANAKGQLILYTQKHHQTATLPRR